MQHGQIFRQTAGYGRFVSMYALDFGRLQDQLRQLLPVAIVVANDDMVDNLREGRGRASRGKRLFGQLRQLCFNHLHIQLLT